MRFEVPQFIEIEDKIFGPLTWRQFVYMGGGAGIAAALFFMTPLIIFVVIGIPILGFSFLLSFYPINNRSFSVFIESVFRFSLNSKLYLWRKKGTGIYKGNEPMNITALSNQTATYTPPTEGSNLQSLSRKLEMKALNNNNGQQ